MPEDRRLTIASTSRLSPDDVARHTFATSRRGFEPAEVRVYLETVARELQAAIARERELLDAVSAAEHRAANPVLDEATLTAALGQETARVLRSAHDAAADLLARAEADVARLRAQAQEEVEQIQARAEQHAVERAAQADAAAGELRRRTQEEMAARLESAKLEAEGLMSQARAECRAMVHEAQELRARVLSDLTRRRRVLHSQIEQLRAGRERLAETIGAVRHAVDKVTDDLFRAEDEARLAAEAAGRQAAAQEMADDLLVAPAEVPAVIPVDGGTSSVAPDEAGADVLETGADVPVDDERRQQAVEDLFARLRAEQEPEVDEGVTLLGEAPEPGAPAGQAGSPPAVQAGAGEVTDRAAHQAAAEDEAEADGTTAGDPLLLRRDELLGPIASALGRRLKRVMQDDQNDILDRLRAKGQWTVEVLPSEAEHEQRYVVAATTHLEEAAKAGAVFGGSKPDDAPSITSVATDLARAVVVPLRRRLDGEGTAAHPGDEAALVDHVGSAFREWKGQRVERVAADHAHEAFSKAVLTVTPPGGELRWVVDDDGAECPDCDDNALAGLVPGGEAFPTGHLHPPAHPGCRCLLAPGTA